VGIRWNNNSIGMYGYDYRNMDNDKHILTNILEEHTEPVTCVSFSLNNVLLASQSRDGVCLWERSSWKLLTKLPIAGLDDQYASLAFHPFLPRLATLGEKDTVIHIWDLDMDVLLGQTSADSVRYTTAKLVLVGDSGVGKTVWVGGWRIGSFKEHSSTHGQQFWVVDDLCTTRKDGTQCEAVLWDLAGQHVYRPIHSIFLDNVDASLVLFDPSNRQDPLKGAQFWLEQLKGKGQLPPSVLVGARVDRGAPAVSQDYLAQFCQRYGISGGYVSTSAKSGEGLDALIELLKTKSRGRRRPPRSPPSPSSASKITYWRSRKSRTARECWSTRKNCGGSWKRRKPYHALQKSRQQTPNGRPRRGSIGCCPCSSLLRARHL